MSSSSRTVTMSAPAQTTTHTIPNLKGGANPATPKLAGIITSSCILFAWVVCFIYWWWNRRREKQAIAAMEADKKLGEGRLSTTYVTTGPIRRTRSRASSTPMRQYPPGTKVLDEKAGGQPPHSAVSRNSGEHNRPNVLSDGARAQSPEALDSRSRSPPGRSRRPLEVAHHYGRADAIQPPHHGTGPLTPMEEVPTRDEVPEPPPKP